MSRIYVGNLDKNTDEEALKAFVARDGRTVTQVLLKRDARNGRSRGFAFVDLETPEQAEAAITSLNGQALDGANVKVNVAKALPEPRRPASRDGGGFGGGGRGRRW